MDLFFLVKTVHIISSTILFGTGIGIAFFMAYAHLGDHIEARYYAVRTTVLADMIFTAPAVIIQPVSGFALIHLAGHDMSAPWLLWTYGLYILAGICWLPVVGIQMKLRDILKKCRDTGEPLPGGYKKLFRLWFILGWPAFIALVVIFFLMVEKPV
ncbi:MAG: DUF2269 domain-containing protein [Pseudobdellovibrionaceae bacterium]